MTAADEAKGLPLKVAVFRLMIAVIVGREVYFLAADTASSLVRLIAGIVKTNNDALRYPIPHMVFHGYFILYGYVLDGLVAIPLAALIVLLLVAVARRDWQWVEVDEEDKPEVKKDKSCSYCGRLIPAAARRCAWCRSPQEPRAEAPADST